MFSTNFKIIIAGGGLAGLALANMLEKFNLDYTLLEAYSDIAPPIGASIGMFPNGLRILDQLGCYEPIQDIFGGKVAYTVFTSRNNKGEYVEWNGSNDTSHGYGLFFFDRQKLLQILYDKIQHKERVHLNKKVTKVSFIEKGVQVTCSDGTLVSGTFLVGADGLHSNVRKSMHELGHSLEPGYFDPQEEDNVPCYYACSFGIAQHVPGWPAGHQEVVSGRGRSQLIVSGPEGRVYWFMFEKLPETKYGKDIPRYTKEDEVEFVKRNHGVLITPEITFGDIFAKRLSSTLTSLHEVVYKKWFFQRIITLGDSAHKPNPIGGQGANGAFESCAELINALIRVKDTRKDGLFNLSNEDINNIFSDVQSARYDRAQAIVNSSHLMQALFAYENPPVSTLWALLGASAGGEGILNAFCAICLGATRIKQLPVPHRPRAIPFHDERPAKPIIGRISTFVRCGFICVMGLVVLASVKAMRPPLQELGGWSKASVQISWFGDTVASRALNWAVSLFEVSMYDKSPSAQVHLSNFLPQLISPLLIYAIEGHRIGNQGTPLAIPLLFSAAMQVQGIARVAPIYVILTSLFGFENPPSRAVHLHVAESLIPAIVIGFLIPTIMMLLPTPQVYTWEKWSALWQFAPLLFNLLLNAISTALKRYRGAEKRDGDLDMSRYEAKDVNILQSVYTSAFAVQATAHIALLAYRWSCPDVSLFNTFLGPPDIFEPRLSQSSLSAKIAIFFTYNMTIGTFGYLGSQLYSIWDLRRLGYIKTDEAVKAGIATLAGQWIVGPGAAWAALWYWREGRIAAFCV